MKRFLILLLLVNVVAGAASAADVDGKYKVKAWGSRSCKAFVVAMQENRTKDVSPVVPFEAWLAGYLSAYNLKTPETYEIAGTDDMDALLKWLYNYCRLNPGMAFAGAVDELTLELYPDRKQVAD